MTVLQAAALLVGVVVGTGIFRTPPVVAANVSSETAFLGLWLLGGVISFIGALCYAELGSAHPHVGGEYHYLHKAYGPLVGFLFGWGRMAVMQSGSIAAIAFVYGDYAAFLVPAGVFGPALHGTLVIVVLSTLQLSGTELTSRAQLVLTLATMTLVLLVAVIGLVASPHAAAMPSPPTSGAAGLAMVFVLLTYGGWSEAAYLSGEVRDPQRDMPRALLFGTVTVTLLYLLVNFGYLTALGLDGLRRSDAVAADMMGLFIGAKAAGVVAGIVCAASLSTLNATMLTGARSIFALGRSFAPFAALGRHGASGRAPHNALIVQAAITIGLIVFGAITRAGFESMVEYTAPVYWTFLFLVGIALFIFRWREPARAIPFRVPLYPVTPLLFCATSLYLLYSSLVYTGMGALIGVGIFLTGIPIFYFGRRSIDAGATGSLRV